MTKRVLVIDNYDSFVYILVQYLGEMGHEPIVVRNDKTSLADLDAMAPDAVLISPGPGRPEDAGLSIAAITHFAGRVPILGVCLGHQCIGHLYGATVARAPELMHGKTSFVHHNNVGVFSNLPSPVEATRYHSLLVEREGLPDELEITAETDSGLIMGLRHRNYAIQGVQFHPESVLTSCGKQMLTNWLATADAVTAG